MADTQVESLVTGTVDSRGGCWGPYYISTTVGLVVFSDDGNDLSFARTDDGGATWATTEIEGHTCVQLAAWFDQETPGDSGNLVHVVYMEQGTPVVKYVALDVNAGTAGTIRTIDSGVTMSSPGSENRCAITKTKGGNLLAAFSTQTEIECYRSVDAGVNWTDRADVYETATEEDWVMMFPANTADDDDAAAFFWDKSANEISVKMYDDSANTWTETSILASMTEDNFHINMDGAVRHSDGLILGCAHSNDDSTTDDIRTWTVTPDSIASPTIDTTTADVITDTAESAQCAMFINQQNDDVYVAYLLGGTWQATVDVVYKKSTDDMASWGSQQAYSEATADDFRFVHAGRTVGNSGGFFQPLFYNQDTTDVWVNLVNDVAIAAAGGAADTMLPEMMFRGGTC